MQITDFIDIDKARIFVHKKFSEAEDSMRAAEIRIERVTPIMQLLLDAMPRSCDCLVCTSEAQMIIGTVLCFVDKMIENTTQVTH